MCELFGACANRDVNIEFTWRGFVRRGSRNRDGWGIGWYVKVNGKSVASVIKQPIPSVESSLAMNISKIDIRSNIIISHVRYATKGDTCYINTHPFVRKIVRSFNTERWDEWIFAHNGGLSEEFRRRTRLSKFKPIGDTDSEYAFCYIAESIEGIYRIRDLFLRLYELADEIKDFGNFNILLSNSRYLFVYSKHSVNSMYYVRRHPPHNGHVRLADEDFSVDLGNIKAPDEYACLISTKKLTDERWIKFYSKKLYIFRDGELVLRVDNSGFKPMIPREYLDVLANIRENGLLELSELDKPIVERLINLKYLKIISGRFVSISENKRALVDILCHNI